MTGPFRYASLERVAPGELALLQDSHTLGRLVTFLMANYKVRARPWTCAEHGSEKRTNKTAKHIDGEAIQVQWSHITLIWIILY